MKASSNVSLFSIAYKEDLFLYKTFESKAVQFPTVLRTIIDAYELNCVFFSALMNIIQAKMNDAYYYYYNYNNNNQSFDVKHEDNNEEDNLVTKEMNDFNK